MNVTAIATDSMYINARLWNVISVELNFNLKLLGVIYGGST